MELSPSDNPLQQAVVFCPLCGAALNYTRFNYGMTLAYCVKCGSLLAARVELLPPKFEFFDYIVWRNE